MILTKARLEENLAGLKQQHMQLVANTNAVLGAIQYCENLLAQLAAAEPDNPAASQSEQKQE